MNTLIIIGLILAIAATVFLYIKVMPANKDGKFENKYLQFLHDYFHFKTLYIEAVTKFIFVLLTCICVFVGFMLLFGKIEYYSYFYGSSSSSTFLYGLGLMILGPIVLRITYELVMMTILLVQNVISINRKLKSAPMQKTYAADESMGFSPADDKPSINTPERRDSSQEE